MSECGFTPLAQNCVSVALICRAMITAVKYYIHKNYPFNLTSNGRQLGIAQWRFTHSQQVQATSVQGATAVRHTPGCGPNVAPR